MQCYGELESISRVESRIGEAEPMMASNRPFENGRSQASLRSFARAVQRERWAVNDSSESNIEVKMGTLLTLLRHQKFLTG